MFRRISLITVIAVLFISIITVPLSSSAYVSASDFFKTYSYNTTFFPSYDGIYLFQTTYKSYYSPDTINSPVKLDGSYFNSGSVWNGRNVSELDSKYLYDLEVAGFSQSVSYTSEGDYFIYSLLTCLPVKAGDIFSITPRSNSTNVRESSYFYIYSYIPGGSGCRMVHNEVGTEHPENPLTYTVKSKNQHIASLFNSDTFNGTPYSDCSFVKSQSVNCLSFDGLTSIGYNAKCIDFFTTSYDYTGDISLVLKDNVKNYAFSVYEIFTDGTVIPGFNTEGEQVTTAPSGTTPSGSGGDDETSKGIFSTVTSILGKMDNIFTAISQIPDKFATKIGEFSTGIVDSIKGIVQDFKDYLEYLFIPSENHFEDCKEIIDEKFVFVHQIAGFYENFIHFAVTDEPPVNRIDFRPLYDFDVEFINWDLYDKYKPFVDGIIVFCSWFFFIRKLYKSLPGIIGGFHT